MSNYELEQAPACKQMEVEDLRQQVTLLRDVLKFYMDNGICEPFYHRVAEALSATKQKP